MYRCPPRPRPSLEFLSSVTLTPVPDRMGRCVQRHSRVAGSGYTMCHWLVGPNSTRTLVSVRGVRDAPGRHRWCVYRAHTVTSQDMVRRGGRRQRSLYPAPAGLMSDNDWWGRILRGPQISGVIVASDAALACTEEVESTVGVSAWGAYRVQCSSPRVTSSRPQVPGSPNARSRLTDRSPRTAPLTERSARAGGCGMTSLPSPPRRTGRLLVYKRGGCACAALPVVFCLESRRGRKGEKFSRLLGDVAIRFRHSAVTENPPPLFLSHSHSPAPPCSWKSRVLAGFRSPVLAAAVVRVVRRGFREGFCGEGFCAPSGGGFFVSLGSFFVSRSLHSGLRLQRCCLWGWILFD